MLRILPWSFLGLFASPAKLLVVASALIAFAWRMGWLQRLLFQALSRQMKASPAPTLRPAPTPPRGRATSAPRTAPIPDRPKRRWNWRKLAIAMVLLLVGILFVTRVHMARSVAFTSKPISTLPTPSSP